MPVPGTCGKKASTRKLLFLKNNSDLFRLLAAPERAMRIGVPVIAEAVIFVGRMGQRARCQVQAILAQAFDDLIAQVQPRQHIGRKAMAFHPVADMPASDAAHLVWPGPAMFFPHVERRDAVNRGIHGIVHAIPSECRARSSTRSSGRLARRR